MTADSEIASSPASPRPSQRLLSLDVLRAVAILMVLFNHAILRYGDDGIFWFPAVKLMWFGWSGVDLFFVLSGFLIGGLLFAEIARTGTLDIPRFLVRRAFKIWPGYFALILTGVALEVYAGHGIGNTLREFWPNFCHLQNYIVPGPDRPQSWALAVKHYDEVQQTTACAAGYRHTWSLAVEEHFYLLLPLALWFFLRRDRGARTVSGAFLGGLFAVMALVLGLRFLNAARGPYTFLTHQAPTHLRFDSLLFGVALAYLFSAHPERFYRIARRPGLLMALAAALMIPIFHFPPNAYFMYTAGYTLIYIACGAALMAFVGCEGRPGLLWALISSLPGRALARIGAWSYSIYLWQFFARDLASKLDATAFAHLSPSFRYLATTGTYLSGAILIGVIMNKLIEAPMLALRDRITRVKGAGAAYAAAPVPAALFSHTQA